MVVFRGIILSLPLVGHNLRVEGISPFPLRIARILQNPICRKAESEPLTIC
jgi:hypothetical protein